MKKKQKQDDGMNDFMREFNDQFNKMFEDLCLKEAKKELEKSIKNINELSNDLGRKQEIVSVIKQHPKHLKFIERCVKKHLPEYLQFVKTTKILK